MTETEQTDAHTRTAGAGPVQRSIRPPAPDEEMKRVAGFEYTPATCRTCIHMETENVRFMKADVFFKQRQRSCGKFAFRVQLNSICDHWTGANGEKLATCWSELL